MIWVRLGILALVSGVILLALTQTAASPPPPQTPTLAPTLATLAPTPAATRVPLPTAPPQMIISRIARETPLPRATATPPAVPHVSAVDNGYLPGQMTVHQGTTVVWTNTGSDGHDVTGDGPGGAWRSGPLAPSEQYQRSFAIVGTYDYACSIHPEMRGRIVVQP
jgi:plastocyanin